MKFWLALLPSVVVLWSTPLPSTSAGGRAHGQSGAVACPADDGSVGAPAGSAQQPNLLSGYARTIKSDLNCKVAGVDYAVGYPAGTSLTDWESVSGTGITVSVANGTVTYSSTSNCTANAIDFSLHNGASLLFDGCNNPTVTNSNFLCGSLCITHVASIGTGVISIAKGTTGNLIIKENIVDGGSQNNSNQGALIYNYMNNTATITLAYNLFRNFSEQVLVLVGGNSVVDTVNYRYNLIMNGALRTGAHLNYQQIGDGTYTITDEFNTTYQTPQASSGEGFQFENATAGLGTALVNPTIRYNTMIAIGSRTAMSYLIHGMCHTKSDCTTSIATLIGSGLANRNYFDTTSAYGAFYPSGTTSMWKGWNFTNNFQMTNGDPTHVPR